MLTVLSIGYPFAPVTADPAGGAEQVLAQLDRALVAAGHRSIVIAPEGSYVAGDLHLVPAVEGDIGDAARTQIYAFVRDRIAAVLAENEVDLIHYHGLDFDAYLPENAVPQLATMHLPIAWYTDAALRSGVRLLPVSRDQASRAPAGLQLLSPVENGVDLNRYHPAGARGDYALTIGRIAEEKGFHDAIAAARRAVVPLVLAGRLYPYPEHRRYFETQVAPALDEAVRWVGAVSGDPKAKLIAEARCLLAPSTAPETSSLITMEALASGTPVIAYRSGALPEVVEDGVTGFIVDDAAGMADAIGRLDEIDPAACRAAAEARFSAARMTDEYLRLYRELAA
ncbi:putative glycosyltransferase [Sphingomonas changbaiensis NBRC 104936]|uniref:Putative glycosyltransferase n=2 Tax=Sphingomonas changbaiensis TaxID=529705 RepID=A0A0E9MN10_9SPHN|nr:putative glycosyltransferase [Sphingomonas changbaiensis NBRC 104936]